MPRSFGADVNQPGNSDYARVSQPESKPYSLGLVEKIVVNDKSEDYFGPTGENVGEIIVRLIPEQNNLDIDALDIAVPLEANVQVYPVQGETVLVYTSPDNKLYYTRPVNVNNSIVSNQTPVLVGRLSPLSAEERDYTVLRSEGVDVPNIVSQTNSTVSEEVFTVPPRTIYKIRPYPGDMILQGRYGNSIRFGSNMFEQAKQGEPSTSELNPGAANILITTGQWQEPTDISTDNPTETSLTKENINEDGSSIWLVEDQRVDFSAATSGSVNDNPAHLRSTSNATKAYKGAQIFINSDRVVLNSKLNEISLFSKKEINLSALSNITVDSEKKILMSANEVIQLESLKNVEIYGDEDFVVGFNGKISSVSNNIHSIVAKEIFIGSNEDRSQPMVLGGALSLFLQQFILTVLANINAGVVVTPTGPGSVTFPSLIAELTRVYNSLGGVITPQAAPFNSKHNFTSKENSVYYDNTRSS